MELLISNNMADYFAGCFEKYSKRTYPESDRIKLSVLDIEVEDENHKLYNIEGQDKKMLKILLDNDEDLRSAHEMYKAFNNRQEVNHSSCYNPLIHCGRIPDPLFNA